MSSKTLGVLIAVLFGTLFLVGAGLGLAAPANDGEARASAAPAPDGAHALRAGQGMGSVTLTAGHRLGSKGRPASADAPSLGLRAGPVQVTPFLSENFELAWPSPGWSVFDDNGASGGDYQFARRNCRHHGGNYSAWAVGGGANGGVSGCGAAYPNNASSWAVFGPLDFSSVSAATLRFSLWVNSECSGTNCATAADPLRIMASTNGANFDGPWWAGNWSTSASADAEGWVAGSFDMKNYAGKPQVWIAMMFESDAAVTYPGGGAFVDDLVLEVTTTACPNAAKIRSVTLDRSCYVPGAQMGVLVDVTTTRASQEVHVRALLLSGDVGIASGEVTFTAPGQRVVPVNIPNDADAGDYLVLVSVYDAVTDCSEDLMTKPTRIDPACRPTDPVPVTRTPTPSPSPTATQCPAMGAGTGTFITTDDNENNAHTGTPDNDMYPGTSACLPNTDPVTPIEFNIVVPVLPAFSTARLLILAYDVDEQDGEVDEVYFNGTKVGALTGADDTWSTSVFQVPSNLVKSGKNLVEITVNVTNDQVNKWCVKIDWGQLVLDHGGGAASLKSAGLRPVACRKAGDPAIIDYDVDTTLPTQEVRVEINITDSRNNTVAATSRTFTVIGAQADPRSETLVLPTGLAPGTYTVTIIVFDTCSSAQQDMWTGTITIELCGSPTYTPTRPPTHTPSPTPSPTTMPCPPLRPEVPIRCGANGVNYIRNYNYEKGDRSWGTYSSLGGAIIGTQNVPEGFFAATFEARLGQVTRQVLYQFVDIPLDVTDASFFVEHVARFGGKLDPAEPLSGRDFFRASIYDGSLSTELVRLWQFDPMSPCAADPSGYNFGPVDLARVRGRTVALVFEFTKVTQRGWFGGVVLDGVHLHVCSPSPPCLVTGDKTASPSVTTPGGEVTVMLNLTGYGGACLPARHAPDVMLVVDRSGSMNDFGGTPITAAKAAAKVFVDRLDLSTDQVGLVSFATTANLDQPLSAAAGAVRASIDALFAAGDTNIADALLIAQAELSGPRHRSSNRPVIVLLSDGRPNQGGDPRVAAAAAKQAGTRIFTVGLGSAVDPDLLRELASAPSDYFFTPDASQLGAIYEQIAGVVNGAPATNVTIVDRLSPYVTLVPGSFTGWPPPEVSADGRTLTWRIPRLGLETRRLSYRVRMTQQVGTWPANDSAVATYTNSQGQPGALTFPIPQVTVRQPPSEPNGPPQSGQPQLMCRDHPKDFGAVPSNPSGEAWWDSPDIWVRNQPDTIEEPQFPIAGQSNYVYVRVRNTGNTSLADIKVHVYATRGSASIVWPDDWMPEIGLATIPALAAGESTVAMIAWTPAFAGHFCFLARLEAPADPITQDGWVPFDNNICQRNVQILDAPPSGGGPSSSSTGTGFGNRQRGSGYGSASVRSQNFPGTGSGTVRFANPALFDRWQQGGGTVSGGTINAADKSIKLDVRTAGGGSGSGTVDLKLDRVPFEGEETSQLLFDLTLPPGAGVPTLDVTQYDEAGNAVGGTTIRQAGRRAPLYLPSLPHGPGLGGGPRPTGWWRWLAGWMGME